jgi:superoxide dismutase, Fe-Mn family
MFKLPDLPFSTDALAPLMSRETLETHHGKHHAGYVTKMNDALKARHDAPTSVEEVVRLAAREDDDKLFNNAAQAWNHAFFWNCLAPMAEPLSGELGEAVERAFGSIDAFRGEFLSRGASHFASGWLWLISRNGELELQDLHDAHTPIVDPEVTPVLVCDLWEHAYYLDHKNARDAFLRGFFDRLANWRFAEAQFRAARGDGSVWRYPD